MALVEPGLCGCVNLGHDASGQPLDQFGAGGVLGHAHGCGEVAGVEAVGAVSKPLGTTLGEGDWDAGYVHGVFPWVCWWRRSDYVVTGSGML